MLPQPDPDTTDSIPALSISQRIARVRSVLPASSDYSTAAIHAFNRFGERLFPPFKDVGWSKFSKSGSRPRLD